MGFDLGKMFGDAIKGVSDFVDKTGKDITKAIDQNGDGKLDLSDIQVVSDRIQAARAESQRIADLERLKPIFPEDFEGPEFSLPKMIRVDVIDKPCLHGDGLCSLSDGAELRMEYVDESGEGILSLLVGMAPARLIVYDLSNGARKELVRALTEIFSGRVCLYTGEFP